MTAESKYFLRRAEAGDFLFQGKKRMDFPALDASGGNALTGSSGRGRSFS
jgi:hypothetical protein